MTTEEFNQVFSKARAEAGDVLSQPGAMQQIQDDIIEFKRENPTTDNSDLISMYTTRVAQQYTETLVYNILFDLLVD